MLWYMTWSLYMLWSVTTVRLVNTFFTSLHCCFVVLVMMRTLKHYSHSSFQVYNAILLPTVTMLYMRSLELTYLVTKGLYPLTNISAFSYPLAPATTVLFSFYEFIVFRFHVWVFIFGFLTYFTKYNNQKILPWCCKWLFFFMVKSYYI